jgi:hypothetical protein
MEEDLASGATSEKMDRFMKAIKETYEEQYGKGKK